MSIDNFPSDQLLAPSICDAEKLNTAFERVDIMAQKGYFPETMVDPSKAAVVGYLAICPQV